MTTLNRRTRPGDPLVNAGLGAVLALGTAFTALMLMDSWGGSSWVPGCATSVLVSVLALLRSRRPLVTAAAGLAVAAAAVVVSLAADLPQEPGPGTALALAVLVGSAIRNLAAPAAVAVAAGGAAVTALAWISGWTGVTNLATMATIGAVVVGLALRLADRAGAGPVG